MILTPINKLQLASSLLLLFTPSSSATADYSCQTTADCKKWGISDPSIGYTAIVSQNMECVADPLAPDYGYCGYVNAKCSTSADCDFGRCESGRCQGFLGAPCSNSLGCLGYLTCGTDGICGGDQADCPNDDQDCFSDTCITTQSPTEKNPDGTPKLIKKCRVAPAAGMWAKAGCSADSNCASNICTENICRDAVAAPGPSQGGTRQKFKRALQNTHEKLAKAMANAFLTGKTSTLGCTGGLTACAVGSTALGYECIDTQSTLESCGGCLPTDGNENATGIDCTSLPNVEEVSCENGRCVVESCTDGKFIDPSGKGCI